MEFTTGGRLEVRITAADVGKRVSVRTLTGAQERVGRFTDTVGVLTAWTDGVLYVTRRDGVTVELAEAALVAGKVVPSTPARRRGVPSASVRELTAAAARGWPAVESERLGEWTLRASDGFTARANSVLPRGDPGLPLDTALDRVAGWYAARGLVPRIQVVPEEDALLTRELAERGWADERHAVLRVGALAPLADREPDARVELSREPDEEWLARYGRASGGRADAAWGVLTGGPSVWFAKVRAPGATGGAPGAAGGAAAIGRCVVESRWAGFAAMETAPEQRRTGLAGAVMAELARRALDEGASAAYLQVETENSAARALYDRLGFADHHSYHYRRAPAGLTEGI
ncbi:GNAT family N-acetyltransferase [Streptomyces boncukensis]|uniref:GNAT family N-acetyltransferase n=1 Tax=Streptomyces boncukensis TaxID=2711219 RepID=A0A6G4WYY9_9ACTN|nr:GNAT family N-acetyltransferase [Streptomyces boncukensis]